VKGVFVAMKKCIVLGFDEYTTNEKIGWKKFIITTKGFMFRVLNFYFVYYRGDVISELAEYKNKIKD
jgi:hypothetical protein